MRPTPAVPARPRARPGRRWGFAGSSAVLGLAELAALAAAATLGGCAGLPTPTAAGSPRLAGRISLQVQGQPERSFSADFDLQGNDQAGELALGGPLGTLLARVQWQPGTARLETPRGETRSTDLASLAQQTFGEPLPIQALPDWLTGRPWPGGSWLARADGTPGFEQLGWRLDLSAQAEGQIVATRPEPPPTVTVRVRLLPR